MKGRKVALFVVALLMCGIATLVPLATSFDVTGPDVVLAWDCPNWSMWINAQGEVWVRNGTNINEPATTLRVEVGPSQMGPFTQFGPFTVPALRKGESAKVGQITLPLGSFYWRIWGPAECSGQGWYHPPTPTRTKTPTQTHTWTPTFTYTSTYTSTYTATPTNTPTYTATATATSTQTPTNTPTDTPTATLVPPTETYTSTPTDTPVTPTETSVPPSVTPTSTVVTVTWDPTPTLTATFPPGTATPPPQGGGLCAANFPAGSIPAGIYSAYWNNGTPLHLGVIVTDKPEGFTEVLILFSDGEYNGGSGDTLTFDAAGQVSVTVIDGRLCYASTDVQPTNPPVLGDLLVDCTVVARGWDPVCHVVPGVDSSSLSSDNAEVYTQGQQLITRGGGLTFDERVVFQVPAGCVVLVPHDNQRPYIDVNSGSLQQLLEAVDDWALSAPSDCLFDPVHRSVRAVAGVTWSTLLVAARVYSDENIQAVIAQYGRVVIDGVNYNISFLFQ